MADHPHGTPTVTRRRTEATPPRFNSLVAAATVMLQPGRQTRKSKPIEVKEWQSQSAHYYDNVGEYRSGVGWLANGMSRINLIAARPPRNPGDDPDTIDPSDPSTVTSAIQARAVELVAMIAGGPVGQSQLMKGFGEHLSIMGLCWLIIEPDLDDPEADTYETWHVAAVDNVEQKRGSRNGVAVDLWRVKDTDTGEFRDVHPNALIVKCWRKHPLRPWEPDAPVRALLPVLEQIQILSQSITASGTSRLAGAGVLALPTEAKFPQSQRISTEPEDPDGPIPDDADLFIETFIETMTVPIKDRGTAAAVVPLVVQIPGEFLEKIQHITFSMPIDTLVGERLEAAIRRFANGMDMPADALLGVADANHWTAWQIAESGVTLHIEPMSETCVEALTEGWLMPALQAEFPGVSLAALRGEAMVWYDSADLRTRPDKSGPTQDAYDRREASAEAYRREIGLNEDDAPDEDETRRRVLIDLAMALPTAAPPILVELGYMSQATADAIAAARAAESGTPPPPTGPQEPREPEPDPEPAPTPNSPPQRPSEPPDENPDESIAAALLAACDGIVYRTLERAGTKLRSQAGRKVHGGSSAIDCDDPATLHTQIDPTVYADLDYLLDGAWRRVPEVAARYGVDAEALTASLTAYTRALLASQHPHDIHRLAQALGI